MTDTADAGPVDGPTTDNLSLAQDMRDALRLAVQMTRVLEYPGEMSTAQVSVLNTLASGPLRVGDLARLGGVTQPGMSQLVSRLETAGYVERAGSDEDARVTLVAMTDRGHEALEKVNRDRNRVLAGYLDQLGPEDATRIRDGLAPLTRLANDIVSHRTRLHDRQN